jgi:serine/threonine protein kinase
MVIKDAMNHKQLNTAQRDWIKSGPSFPEVLKVEIRNSSFSEYIILERDRDGRVLNVGSRMGFKGFVLKVQDINTQSIYAAKICVSEDYDNGRSEFIECQLASKLRPAGSLFVVPVAVGRVKRFLDMPGPQDEFVCFLTDWVDGETIESIAEGSNTTIKFDVQFVCAVIQNTLRAVHFLKSLGLKHDDLHWGNIMVRKPHPGLILSDSDSLKYDVSIVDMGSLKPIDQETSKSKDDDLYLLKLIVDLYNSVWRNRALASENPIFLEKLRTFSKNLSDEDHLRFYPDDRDKNAAIDDIQKSIGQGALPNQKRQFHPFEAISAEHLTDDKILLDLFVNKLPWFNQAFSPKPLVLSGPRGCGKSMLFRYMAARMYLPQEDSKQGEYIPNFFCVYISCATYLQNSLMWLSRKENRVKENAEAIITFFNLVVAREFFKAIEYSFSNTYAKQRFGLNEIGIDQIINYTKSLFDTPIESPRLNGKSHALHFSDDLDRARINLQNDLLNNRKPFLLLPETFLGDITSKLKEYLPKLEIAKVVFLLDDYSNTRIHTDIQSVLNRIIFEKRSSHYFKISCEKFGFIAADIDGVRIDETREYDVIDAGDKAICGMVDSTKKDFITNLIDRRLKTAEWEGNTKTLIGSSNEYKNDVALAKFIREKASRPGNHKYYHGIDHLSQLWSGDIATILQVVRDMFIRGNVTASSNELIQRNIQHDSIVQVSKAFRERVAGYYPFGFEMSKVVDEFGIMAKNILSEGSLTNNGEPRRLYRVEMTKNEQLPLLSLLRNENSDAADIAQELLRRAVFIQLSDSRGKESQGSQTARWEIRKIFLPSFGLSLVRHSYIDLKNVHDFIRLFVEPRSFKEIQVQKYLDKNISLFDFD